MTGERLPYLCDRLQPFGGASVFAEMSALAVRTGAINLGQGFPDANGPAAVAEAAIEAIRGDFNQYPPGIGYPVLRQAVAEHQKRFWGLEFDPDTEVLVTAGATEAITASVLALAGPGDEVVTFEPYFDIYPADISMAGAERRLVQLRPPPTPSTPTSWPRRSVPAPECCCSTPRTIPPARCSASRSSTSSPGCASSTM